MYESGKYIVGKICVWFTGLLFRIYYTWMEIQGWFKQPVRPLLKRIKDVRDHAKYLDPSCPKFLEENNGQGLSFLTKYPMMSYNLKDGFLAGCKVWSNRKGYLINHRQSLVTYSKSTTLCKNLRAVARNAQSCSEGTYQGCMWEMSLAVLSKLWQMVKQWLGLQRRVDREPRTTLFLFTFFLFHVLAHIHKWVLKVLF